MSASSAQLRADVLEAHALCHQLQDRHAWLAAERSLHLDSEDRDRTLAAAVAYAREAQAWERRTWRYSRWSSNATAPNGGL